MNSSELFEMVGKTDHKGGESDVAKEVSKEELDPGKYPAARRRFLLFFDGDFPGEMRLGSETVGARWLRRQKEAR